MLTPHQQIIFDQVMEALKAGHKRIVLMGSAGVGKTFLATELINAFVHGNYFRSSKWFTEAVYVTAPTNKALSILQNKIPNHPNIIFKTVHSALKLKRNVNTKTGKVTFTPDFSEKNKPFEGCKIAFLDECSMLNTKLLEDLDDYQFPIIFLGDDKQLFPVGESNSPVFQRGYPVFELTEIIRQGAGNPIIDLSRNLALVKSRENRLVDERGYIFFNEKSKLVDNLAEANGTDALKYLAFTNDEVNAMNKLVRQRLYGTVNPEKIMLGETLVFNKPKGDIYTNQEVRVDSLAIITEPVRIPTAFSKFVGMEPTNTDTIKMRVYRINDTFNIIHKDSERMFNSVLKAIEGNCAKFGWNWKGKYFFEEQFADATYNHAITIHKSQGSTYREAILNVGNVMWNPNAEDRQRLLYTGVTRASNVLILNNA